MLLPLRYEVVDYLTLFNIKKRVKKEFLVTFIYTEKLSGR